MSLIEEGFPQQIRMANLACIGECAIFYCYDLNAESGTGSRKVNGVAEVRSSNDR